LFQFLKYRISKIYTYYYIVILVFIISWKGLNTIDKYQSKKDIDLKYQNKLRSIEQYNEQLHKLNLSISKVHIFFVQFNNVFIDFESEFVQLTYGEDFGFGKMKHLGNQIDELKLIHRRLQETIEECYLLNTEIIDPAYKYAFVLSDYLYGHTKVLNHMEHEKDLPYEISCKNEYFQTHFVFQDDLTAPLFDLFNQFKRNIQDANIISTKES